MIIHPLANFPSTSVKYASGNPVLRARARQAVESCGAPGGVMRPTEEKILSTERDISQRGFAQVVVGLEAAVVEKACEGSPVMDE